MQGVPTVTITSSYYSREGLAVHVRPQQPGHLRELILGNNLPKPQPLLVAAFKQAVIERYAAQLPQFCSGVIPACNLAQRVLEGPSC